MKPASERNELAGNSRIDKHLAPVGLRSHDSQFGPIFTKGCGAKLWTENGECFVDLKCGYSANNFGHAFPPLVEALQSHMSVLGHLTGDLHRNKLLLAARLSEIFGPLIRGDEQSAQVIFNTGGARAVESAWKAATSIRPGAVLSLSPGFHGRSIATSVISDTNKCLADSIKPTAYRVAQHSYPYCVACPLNLSYPSCELACTTNLEQNLLKHASEISCVIVEPALGPRGYVFPPAAFFRWLRDVTDENGILLVADEIQTGLGRCGGWLLSASQGWQPDLVVLGKSLGGGFLPISTVIGRPALFSKMPPGSESETFSAQPLACAMALTVLHELECGQWIEHGKWVGETLRKMAWDFFRSQTGVAIEGIGACCVIDFIRCAERERLAEIADESFTRHKILLHRSGPFNSRFVLLPPITLNKEDLAEVQQRLERAFDQINHTLSRSDNSHQ